MQLRSLSTAFATVASVMTLAGNAAAQFTAQGSVSVGATVQPPPVQAQVVYAPPPPPGPVMYAPAPQPMYVMAPPLEDYGRLRFGFDIGGGGMVLGPLSGAAFNMGVRLGWQLNHSWAVYYQGNIPIGVAAGRLADGRAAAGALVVLTNTVAAEYTFAHVLHFGLGPSIDNVFGAVCANTPGSTTSTVDCVGSAGWAFGANARVAVTLGSIRPGRRVGFTLGLDLHPIFLGDGTAAFFSTLGLGAEWH